MSDTTPRTYHLVSLRHPIAVQTSSWVVTRTSTLLVVWGKDHPGSGQEVTVHAVVTELGGEWAGLDVPAEVYLPHGTIAATQLFRGPLGRGPLGRGPLGRGTAAPGDTP